MNDMNDMNAHDPTEQWDVDVTYSIYLNIHDNVPHEWDQDELIQRKLEIEESIKDYLWSEFNITAK